MPDSGKEITSINIEDELKRSYLDYAMSVIVGRALPDVRDGLKPVHRRVLFAMNELNNSYNRPYIKSARVVGDVIGKYHPHGDSAAYETMVRMAQYFMMRYPLIDPQGNFGSQDGDGAAAQRYTEVRMAKIAHQLLADLDKETVDFIENYDSTLTMPEVLPSRVPNLLVNGSSGIAVGMATNIPPHNLTEVIDACLALMDDPEIDTDGLMEHIEGPDFPTGAIINGRAGIVQAYRSGRGRILVRSRAEIETDEKSGRETIIVTEIPFQLNRARLVERIADLVKDKKLEGISELRDESTKDTRIVIELRRGEITEVVLNNLYSQTQMQSVFGINMVALVDDEPKLLNLKQILEAFILHRREVVTRRTVYLLRRARERGHILEGQATALANIDPVIKLIKESASPQDAREALVANPWEADNVRQMLEKAGSDACRPDDLPEQYGLKDDGKYYLSPDQAQAILTLQLNRLTGLEQEKLLEEYQDLIETIAELMKILADPQLLMSIIRQELEEIKEEYGDERLTEIVDSQTDLTAEDLITEQDMVVTISHSGYAKTQPLDAYSAQRRGGRGKTASMVKQEDYIAHLMVANTHDTILCFTSLGKVYWMRVFQILAGSRASRGRPLVNMLPLSEDERITAILPVHEYRQDEFIFMATTNGTVKKSPLVNFARQRSTGLIAIELEDDNTLVGVAITDGTKDVMLFSSSGKVIRFKESNVRAMGRAARGVRGIKLKPGEEMISLIIPADNGQILIASENGYGKRTRLDEFSVIGRGGQGMIAMKTGGRNGAVVGAVQVYGDDEMILISDQGILVRTRTEEVSMQGRNTQGVRLINLSEGEHLVGLERVAEPEMGNGTEADDAAPVDT
ncbi:MAG TPA: DNA gyrase subunit A [Pseudomonadales bacterium]|jgi:DNA gyrase subunit A|nr:DNA gyrase subunit A [Pseudomonadales bacterium]|tara:strand:+ start:2901 stop:5477 length:2577 start_codon:yes stop_codon:yes gene_type:complete